MLFGPGQLVAVRPGPLPLGLPQLPSQDLEAGLRVRPYRCAAVPFIGQQCMSGAEPVSSEIPLPHRRDGDRREHELQLRPFDAVARVAGRAEVRSYKLPAGDVKLGGDLSLPPATLARHYSQTVQHTTQLAAPGRALPAGHSSGDAFVEPVQIMQMRPAELTWIVLERSVRSLGPLGEPTQVAKLGPPRRKAHRTRFKSEAREQAVDRRVGDRLGGEGGAPSSSRRQIRVSARERFDGPVTILVCERREHPLRKDGRRRPICDRDGIDRVTEAQTVMFSISTSESRVVHPVDQ